MTAYDPTTASRLIAWARAARPAISATRSIAMAMMIERLNAMADQLEAATVEVVRSRDASDDCARDRCINVLTEYARLLGIGERAIEQWRHRSDPLSPMSLAMLAAPVAERDKANSESEQLRCHDCDLPLATQADWHGTPEGEGADLCWRPWAGDVCCRSPVDWRARALAAEELLERPVKPEIALKVEEYRRVVEQFHLDADASGEDVYAPEPGFYSVVQFCPDIDRVEAANVGVIIGSPKLGMRVRMAERNEHVRRRFGGEAFDDTRLTLVKGGLAERLKEVAPTAEALRAFGAAEAGKLQISAPRPMVVSDLDGEIIALFRSLVDDLDDPELPR